MRRVTRRKRRLCYVRVSPHAALATTKWFMRLYHSAKRCCCGVLGVTARAQQRGGAFGLGFASLCYPHVSIGQVRRHEYGTPKHLFYLMHGTARQNAGSGRLRYRRIFCFPVVTCRRAALNNVARHRRAPHLVRRPTFPQQTIPPPFLPFRCPRFAHLLKRSPRACGIGRTALVVALLCPTYNVFFYGAADGDVRCENAHCPLPNALLRLPTHIYFLFHHYTGARLFVGLRFSCRSIAAHLVSFFRAVYAATSALIRGWL